MEMQKKKELNPTINSIKKILIIPLCFIPILVVLLVTREYFIGYLIGSVQIFIMGFLISLVFKYYKQILNIFMLPSYYDGMITSKISTYYLKFIINAFCLTFAISILFYNENINFLQYSYPALAFLCASRILQYKDVGVLKEFIEVIHGLVIIVILFAFMRLMGVLSKLEESSLFAMSFVNIPVITKEDICLFVLLSISVWAILSIFERLKLVKQKLI